jgi:hypothetical protein
MRPGPASARAQASIVAISDGQKSEPGCTTPAAGAACGGHVPACARDLLFLPPFAIALLAWPSPLRC